MFLRNIQTLNTSVGTARNRTLITQANINIKTVMDFSDIFAKFVARNFSLRKI